MKSIKFYVDKALWERFYRIFPGHGERSGVLRKVVREIVSLHAELPSLSTEVGKRIMEDLEDA